MTNRLQPYDSYIVSLSRGIGVLLTALVAGCSNGNGVDPVCTGSDCYWDAGQLDGTPADVAQPDALPDGGTRDQGTVPDAGVHPDAATEVRVDPGEEGRLLVRGSTVLTMTSANPIVGGEVYIENGRIACVGGPGSCASQSSGATVVQTQGLVMPGLVDIHNHIAYNWLPEWEPGRMWNDHTHWQGSSEYDVFTDPYSANKGTRESFCAMLQWGELRSLFSGATTVAGAPQARTCIRWLVRNAELSSNYSGWSADRMRTNVLGTSTLDAQDAANLSAAMDAGNVTSYLIHLGEGISTRAHDEYTDLVGWGLLRPETVIIHGTALTAADFTQVANAGAKIVWSPSSNMVLYGDTTNVEAAINAGVSVSIAPDWTPSGADDQLAELRFARDLIDSRWPGLFNDRDLVEMSTRIPAEQVSVQQDIGTLEVGKYGDLLVLSVDDTDPYYAVVHARAEDIRLVTISGIPTYGEPALMGPIPGTPLDCFDVTACTVVKRGCWEATPDGQVSPSSIASVIESFYPPGPLSLFTCD